MNKSIIILFGIILSLSAKSQNWEALQGGVVITVYDLIGKVVYTETIKNPTTQINKSINLNSFSNGMYLLNIQLDDVVLSKKLIKQ